MSFSDLKNQKGSACLAGIQQKLEQMAKANRQGGEDDRDRDRYWKPTISKDGVSAAIIRFLPVSEGDDFPWVEGIEYAFEGPGGWYIERSLSTIGQPDPVQELFSSLYATGIEANKDKAKTLKRKIVYVSNILVVKDPANPANEGKVFLYKYGKQIYNKIVAEQFPEKDELDDTTKEGINIWCPWEGANFKLRVTKEDGYPSYLKSEFASPTPLFDGDEVKIQNLWDSQYKLAELLAPSSFKSYDQLKKRMERVLGTSFGGSETSTPKTESRVEPKAPAKKPVSKQPEPVESDDEDDDMKYLQALAMDDDINF